MPVIPLVPLDPPTLIYSLLCLSAHHLALAASASQPLKSGTLSLYLSVPVPVLTPFVITPRRTLLPAGLPIHLAPLLLRLIDSALQTIVHVYKLYLLTYY